MGSEPIYLNVIGEQFVITYWWIAFLVTFFHVGISSFLYSFKNAKTIEDRIK